MIYDTVSHNTVPHNTVPHNTEDNEENYSQESKDSKDSKDSKGEKSIEPGSKKRGKWTEEELEIVRNTLKMYSSLSLKSIKAYLSSTYAIDISESVLGRIRKESS
jgi:hypothetical protein